MTPKILFPDETDQRLQELRIPLILADGFIVLTMSIYENKVKMEQDKVKLEDAHQKEEDKATERAKRAAQREKNKQEKLAEKKAQNKGHTSFAGRKNPIQQPDKNKKKR